MNQLIDELKKWEIEGFNNHEQMALNAGYYDKYFPDYLLLKLKLLKARDNNITQKGKRTFFNALRIYTYSIWENLWFGYLMAYSQCQKSYFLINSQSVEFINAYLNHLPSFSSAILHFGSCRDLFFVLLKVWCDGENSVSDKNIYRTITVSYTGKNGKNKFRTDLESISKTQIYMQEALKVYDHNEFRNFFAHRLRLLWWHNKKCSPIEYFIKRNVFEDIKHKRKDSCKKNIYAILDDHKAYENSIERSGCSELISSGEILRETHDLIANFFNKTLGFMSEKI